MLLLFSLIKKAERGLLKTHIATQSLKLDCWTIIIIVYNSKYRLLLDAFLLTISQRISESHVKILTCTRLTKLAFPKAVTL